MSPQPAKPKDPVERAFKRWLASTPAAYTATPLDAFRAAWTMRDVVDRQGRLL